MPGKKKGRKKGGKKGDLAVDGAGATAASGGVQGGPIFVDGLALRNACLAGDLATVRMLLAAGAPADEPAPTDGYTPLMNAIQNQIFPTGSKLARHGEVVAELLAHPAVLASRDVQEHTGVCALALAATQLDAAGVTMLLAHGFALSDTPPPGGDRHFMMASVLKGGQLNVLAACRASYRSLIYVQIVAMSQNRGQPTNSTQAQWKAQIANTELAAKKRRFGPILEQLLAACPPRSDHHFIRRFAERDIARIAEGSEDASVDALKFHMCASCHTPHAKQLCSRCKTVRYCCRDCQVSHWKAHKAHCKKMVAANTEEAALRAAVTAAPASVEAHRALGDFLLLGENGVTDLDGAEASFRAAVKAAEEGARVSPAVAGAKAALVRAQRRLGMFLDTDRGDADGAIDAWRVAVQLGPVDDGHWPLTYNLALLIAKRKRDGDGFEEAMGMWGSVVRGSPPGDKMHELAKIAIVRQYEIVGGHLHGWDCPIHPSSEPYRSDGFKIQSGSHLWDECPLMTKGQ